MSTCSFKWFPVSEALKPIDCVRGNLQPSFIRAKSHYQGMLSNALMIFFFRVPVEHCRAAHCLFALCPTRKTKKVKKYADNIVRKK